MRSVTALEKTGGCNLNEIDTKSVESDLRKIPKTDKNMHAVDRVISAMHRVKRLKMKLC